MAAKPKAIIVGGSIAGLSCAHSILSFSSKWDVIVLERARAPPSGNLTGAGLCLDPQSIHFLQQWLPSSELLLRSTLPLQIDQNQATDWRNKVSWCVTKDDEFNFRAAHWSDLHGLLYNTLPEGIMYWGHEFVRFRCCGNGIVRAEVKIVETGEVVEIVGDLLIAADGCNSSVRRNLWPNLNLRYLGYCAWRGVLDFSGNELSETMRGIRRVYQDLGKCLYFDMSERSHCVLYELQNRKLNWLWYRAQDERDLKMQGSSVTMRVTPDTLRSMHEEAELIWTPELVKVMKETADPFVNAIYDADPLEKLYWDNIVLVGDAAHPTSPHGLRSTNMSILDAGTLSLCLEKHCPNNLHLALEEYERHRLPVVCAQVLHSRKLGQLKQGLDVHHSFSWKEVEPEDCEMLLQRNMPFFHDAPLPSLARD